MGRQSGYIISRTARVIIWPVIINGFGICYMLNVCLLSRYISPVVEICYLLNVCLLSCYISPVVEICYMLNVCLLSRYISPVVEIC